MECPKCHAQNHDQAPMCTLCYEPLKARPGGAPSSTPAGFAPVGASAGGGHFVALPETTLTFDDHQLDGPLVIREDGLYLFVKSCVSTKQKKEGLGSMVGDNFGLVGSLLGAAFDSLSEQKQAVTKPSRLTLNKCWRVLAQFKEAAKTAPDIPQCQDYFTVQKREMQELTYNFTGMLSVKTKWYTLSFGNGLLGLGDREKVEGFLLHHKFPLNR